MRLAPACTPDDCERLSCPYIGKATVAAVTPDFVCISGLNFQSDVAELPLWADVSYIHAGDPVTAVEWKGHIVSIIEKGRTLAAMGNPDAGPVAWPGVLVFCAVFGAGSFALWQLGKRTRVTITRNFWAGAGQAGPGSSRPS